MTTRTPDAEPEEEVESCIDCGTDLPAGVGRYWGSEGSRCLPCADVRADKTAEAMKTLNRAALAVLLLPLVEGGKISIPGATKEGLSPEQKANRLAETLADAGVKASKEWTKADVKRIGL